MPLTLFQKQQRYLQMGIGDLPRTAVEQAIRVSGGMSTPTSEVGYRSTPENFTKYLYRTMWVDPELRAAILDIREMDRLDGRVKKVHARMARTATKGGLRLKTKSTNRRLSRAWEQFVRRLNLHRREKLESDCRGLVMEGNLPMQWLVDDTLRVVGGVRMPSETILPRVDANGVFSDLRSAYEQYDLTTGARIATFPLWRLSLVRLTPDNYDDQGSLGRPYLDAVRTVWRKLVMTEEDLVIRRRTRAPLRLAHVLEGANEAELKLYRQQVEDDQKDITTDYYLNKKGGVNPIQGDANLDQIADVAHLLDTFFSGSPAPKGLFGYVGDLSRDVLEDLKRDYFDEIDALQDTLSYVYFLGFHLDLLLQGMNPENFDFDVIFAERRTDTPNQRADLALKYQAIGASMETVIESAGLDPSTERERLEDEAEGRNPYPRPDQIGTPPRVSVTPGNARKGESATDITTRSNQ